MRKSTAISLLVFEGAVAYVLHARWELRLLKETKAYLEKAVKVINHYKEQYQLVLDSAEKQRKLYELLLKLKQVKHIKM